MLFGSDKANPTLYEGARTAGAIESYAISQLELNVEAPEVVELVGQVLHRNLYSAALGCLAKHSSTFIYASYNVSIFLLFNASIILKMSIATFNCRVCWTKSVGLLRSVLSHFYLTFWTLKLKVATSTSQLCGMLQRSTKEMLTGKPQGNTIYIY